MVAGAIRGWDAPRPGVCAPVRPIRTGWSLSGGQFSPDEIEVGQGEQSEEVGRVLGKAPVSDLAIAPQVLDHAKGMFDPCACAIALLVERQVRAVETLATAGLVSRIAVIRPPMIGIMGPPGSVDFGVSDVVCS